MRGGDNLRRESDGKTSDRKVMECLRGSVMEWAEGSR